MIELLIRFDDRQKAQRTVANAHNKEVKLESKIKYNRVICQSQNSILKVQVNTNKENLKYIIKEGSCV